MRYKVRYPLEDGKRIAVFDLKDSLFPEKRKVLTLLPVSGSEADYSGLVKKIEARSSIIHPALPRILDITFRGKNMDLRGGKLSSLLKKPGANPAIAAPGPEAFTRRLRSGTGCFS